MKEIKKSTICTNKNFSIPKYSTCSISFQHILNTFRHNLTNYNPPNQLLTFTLGLKELERSVSPVNMVSDTVHL